MMDSGEFSAVHDGTESKRSSRTNACDLNGEEFQIVCEELWIDFKSWVNNHNNFSDGVNKVHVAVVSNWRAICLNIVFLVWFRWYIGVGKEACAYSLGYGVFSFVCEVLRYVGEFVSAIILMFIGFCVGIMPVVVCVCFYEFKDAFPDPDEVDSNTDEDDSDTDDEHLKKE